MRARRDTETGRFSPAPGLTQKDDPLYGLYWNIRYRCYRPSHHAFARYGGRGIIMCDAWLTSFDAFKRDVGPRPSPNHTIDRIDNNGNYEPGNVRWATRKLQARNAVTNRMMTHNGETRTMAEWCELLGLRYNMVSNRVLRGWTDEDALSPPVFKRLP